MATMVECVFPRFAAAACSPLCTMIGSVDDLRLCDCPMRYEGNVKCLNFSCNE